MLAHLKKQIYYFQTSSSRLSSLTLPASTSNSFISCLLTTTWSMSMLLLEFFTIFIVLETYQDQQAYWTNTSPKPPSKDCLRQGWPLLLSALRSSQLLFPWKSQKSTSASSPPTEDWYPSPVDRQEWLCENQSATLENRRRSIRRVRRSVADHNQTSPTIADRPFSLSLRLEFSPTLPRLSAHIKGAVPHLLWKEAQMGHSACGFITTISGISISKRLHQPLISCPVALLKRSLGISELWNP